MLILVGLWVGISFPLTFAGFYFGFRKQPYEHPVRTNQIPRQIPEQVWYLHPFFAWVCALYLIVGFWSLVLFLQVSYSGHFAVWSCVCGTFLYFHSKLLALQLYSVRMRFSISLLSLLPLSLSFTHSHLYPFSPVQAIWENQFYYLFGFLFLVFIILVIACSEVSIVMTYFQLCGEDYNWWWRSFFLSGSASYYVLAYSIIYFFTKVGEKDRGIIRAMHGASWDRCTHLCAFKCGAA